MLALGTSGDVRVFEVLMHVGPVVGSSEGLVAFVKAKMSKGVVSQVVKQFPDLEVLWDHKSATDIEEVIGEGCPFNAPHVNVLHELLGKVVSPVAINDGVEEGVVSGNVKYPSDGYGWCIMGVGNCTGHQTGIGGSIRHSG
jgi:hypothetical protein